MADRESPPPVVLPPMIQEVRYSLPDLQAEIELERNVSSFGMETLDQAQIRTLFANRKRRHARDKK